MAFISRDEFIDCIRRSGLVDEERLARFLLDSLQDSDDVLTVSKLCVDAKLLTDWQRERLMEKKSRGFFLGKYKILYPLGAGAMGTVFLAEHRVMRQRVALKVLAKRLAARPANVARFEREARAAAVVSHPNVVRAYDIDRDGDTHYLVMEYVEGENLQKIVQKEGPLEPLRAADCVIQIARGLHEAHKNGMVHRDIKPSNILLDPAGVVKILDLGLARLQDDEAVSLTIANDTRMIGTVDYLAPEQALNSHAIDGRADIYSLGCTLYYLLTGYPPFPTGSLTERILKHQSRRPLDIRKRRPGVPDELVSICFRMMEKNPQRRYQMAGDAADALAAFGEGQYENFALNEANQTCEDSDSGLQYLAEDSSAGRSGGAIPNSTAAKSLTTKSHPLSRNSAVATASEALESEFHDGASLGGVASQRVASSPIAASNAANSGHEASSLRKITGSATSSATSSAIIQSVSDDLDLTPVESFSPKHSSGSMAAKSFIAAPKESLSPVTTPGNSHQNPQQTSSSSERSKIVSELVPLENADPLRETTTSDPVLFQNPLLESSTVASLQGGLPSLLDAVPLAKESSTTSTPHSESLSSSTHILLAQAQADLEDEGGVNYSLWFLIAAGLILSVVLIVVGFSYIKSFSKAEQAKEALEKTH